MAKNSVKTVVYGSGEHPDALNSTTEYSSKFTLTEGNHASVHMTWSAGNLTATLWLSNKDDPDETDDDDWVEVEIQNVTLPTTSSDGKFFAPISDVDATWGRWKLTTSTTANVWVCMRTQKGG